MASDILYTVSSTIECIFLSFGPLSFAVQYAPRIQLITLLHQLHFSFTQSNIYSDQYNKYFIKKGEISWEWMFGLFRLFGKMTKFLPTNDSETITQKKKSGPHLQSCLGHIWHCLTSWQHKATQGSYNWATGLPNTGSHLEHSAPAINHVKHGLWHLWNTWSVENNCVYQIQMCLLCGKTGC